LALVEVQLWTDGTGRTLIVPQIPVRTQVIRQRPIVDGAGAALAITEETASSGDDEIKAAVDPDKVAARARNRAY
jgi:hypothetical protein